MNYFDIRPSVSWKNFKRNTELTERIYDLAMASVAKGDWGYINPATGFGIFEDAAGNFVFLETLDQGSQTLTVDMHCGLNDETSSEMARFIAGFTEEFGLKIAPMEQK